MTEYLRRGPETQAAPQWRRPRGVLGGLVASAEQRVDALRPEAATLIEQAAGARRRVGFGAALAAGDTVAVIAELKRRSPSKGDIALRLDAGERAAAYAAAGAAALSVLTEPTQFGGSLADLDSASIAGLPLLRKDFIVDRLQLFEAKMHGASAVLLIARALPPEHLSDLHAEAVSLGLDVLVEVHDEAELHRAIDARFPVIGVNNRDLESLDIDDGVSERLLPYIPRASIAVYESGIRTRAAVERAAVLGADAILVGTALSSAADPAAGMRELTGVMRSRRHAS